MYKKMGIKKLGRTASHRKSLKKNLVRSLFANGKVETTTPKAKVLKGHASSVLAKYTTMNDGLVKRREVESYLGKGKALENFQQAMNDKNVKISIVKTRFRDGDNAEMSRVTLVGLKKAEKKKTSAKKATKKKEVEKETQDVKLDTRDGKKEKIGDKLKKTFTSAPERARSRSGL